MAQLNHVPHLGRGMLVQDVGDDVLAFDGETVTRLTGSAARVARAVDGIRALADLTRDLGEDVGEAVDVLIDHGLVDLQEPAPGQRYRRPDHVGACAESGRVVLLDLSTGDRHVLDGGGSTVWELVTSGLSVSSAIDELEQAYPGSGTAEDATRLIEQLMSSGLLEALGTIPLTEGSSGPSREPVTPDEPR